MRLASSAVLTLTLFTASCASEPVGTPFVERSYTLQTDYSIGQGEEIFAARTGEYFEDEMFVGLLYGGYATDTWEEKVEDHKLIFSGMDRGRIDANYQHTSASLVPINIESSRNPLVASRMTQRLQGPGNSVFRDVHFDDYQTKGINYAGVQVQIIEATPQRLRYRITADNFGEGLTRAQIQEGKAPAPESDDD